MFGGVHTSDFFSRNGQRDADDERRVMRIESMGYEVLVVTATEMKQTRWADAVARVGTFLDEGRGKW